MLLDVTPCSLVKASRNFRRSCCLHQHGSDVGCRRIVLPRRHRSDPAPFHVVCVVKKSGSRDVSLLVLRFFLSLYFHTSISCIYNRL